RSSRSSCRMKSLLSIAFGAAALATAAFASPAEARSNVGVYVGPGGASIQVGYYNPCRDYWYRREHPYRCGYRHYYRERYSYSYPYNYGYYRSHHNYGYYRRHHRHHRHHDYDRWDRYDRY